MTLRSRRPFLIIAIALATTWLAACGGGGDGDAKPAIDIGGVWVSDARAIGGVAGLMLAGGDTAYGYQIEEDGTTRYFKGSGHDTDSEYFTYASSRFDQAAAGSTTAAASVSGKLIGSYVPGRAPPQLFVTFSTVGFVSPRFWPMHMDTPPADVNRVADAREFQGSYPLPEGSLSLTASAAGQATLTGTGVNGCAVSGTLALARPDRNVWVARLAQSQCATPARNGAVARGLATMYKSGATFNLAVVAEDGLAWTVVSSSR